MTRRSVVITGVGCLGPYGLGLDALRRALAEGRALGTPIDRSAGYHRRGSATQVAACGALDLTPWLSEEDGRRMSDLSQYAVTSARMALRSARLDELPAERTAVAIGTAFGPGGFTERLALQVLQKGGRFASPFLFTDCVANAAAGQIAIAVGARGPNTTICQREASAVLALAQGADDVALGRADVCLAGAADELKPLSHAILDRFRALARPRDGVELPRPLASHRNGYLAGEGATVLVLEEEGHARARGATVLARVGRSARAFDPTASRVGHGTSAAELAAQLEERLGADLMAADAVVSAASGARRGDALEATILYETLREDARVLTPKAVHGEFGGGTLAAALLALQGADFAVPEGCNHDEPDDERPLRIPLLPGPVSARTLLCPAHAAGGVSAWTMLERP